MNSKIFEKTNVELAVRILSTTVLIFTQYGQYSILWLNLYSQNTGLGWALRQTQPENNWILF